MGVVAERTDNDTIWGMVINPNDDSIWYAPSLAGKIYHVSKDMDAVLLDKSTELIICVQDIDADRKQVWCLGSTSARRVYIFNYLGNVDFYIDDLQFNALNSLKLFLPKIFSGYPTAKAEANVTRGENPLTVVFCATNSFDSDGLIIDYAWDFNGDGVFEMNGADLTIVTNTYSEPGRYSVMLRVTDDDGLQDYDSDIAVGVGPLTVYPQASETSGVAKLSVDFSAEVVDGLGDGNMENYQWDFDGDGVFDYVSLTTPNTSHTYDKAGDYVARIKVLSKAGEIAEATVNIHVSAVCPQCSISAQTSSINEAQKIKFTINYSDNDGIVKSINADLNGDGVFEYSQFINNNNGYRYVEQFFGEPGSYNIKAFAIDDDGNYSSTGSVSVSFFPGSYELVALYPIQQF
jgi:PKD repeat protein